MDMNVNGTEDPSDYDTIQSMMERKLSQQKRFVQFDERKDHGVVTTDMFKILARGKGPYCPVSEREQKTNQPRSHSPF